MHNTFKVTRNNLAWCNYSSKCCSVSTCHFNCRTM